MNHRTARRLASSSARVLRHATRDLCLAAGAVLLLAGTAVAQTAEEILRDSVERHQERMEGIENYTLLQSVDGTTFTFYYERVVAEGDHVGFRMVPPHELMARRGDDAPGMPPGGLPDATPRAVTGGGSGEAAREMTDPYAMFEALAPRARLEGTEAVNGHEAYVIAVDDMSGIQLGDSVGGEGLETISFRPRSLRMWLDAERYVPLRGTMEAVVERSGEENEISLDSWMSDYREVDGMLHPFRTVTVTEGLMDAALDEEQRTEMQEAMAGMQEQLEQMDEQQRATFEKMMKDRMPNMEAMSGSGPIETTIEVQQLKVNAGPPENAGLPSGPPGGGD